MSLPTTGPILMLKRRCSSQDMYLAGSFLMFLAVLTVIGVLRLRSRARRARPPHPPARGNDAMTPPVDQVTTGCDRSTTTSRCEPFDPYIGGYAHPDR